MKEIPLTRGYVALVDDEDFPRLSRWKWHAQVSGNGVVYAARKRRRSDGEGPAAAYAAQQQSEAA